MKSVKLVLKIIFLSITLFGLYLLGSQFVPDTGALQMTTRETVQVLLAVLAVSFIDVLLLSYLISRANLLGWRLAAVVAIVFFGIKIVLSQIESWYFLTEISTDMLRGFLLMGVPAALLFSPLVVLVLGKFWGTHYMPRRKINLTLPAGEWIWKTALLAGVFYPVLYFTSGYFVVWQSADARAYFGQTALAPFGTHMLAIFRDSPELILLQIGRGVLWLLLAVLIMRTIRSGVWETAIFTGLSFALLMNNVHLIPNPLMPETVRLFHFLESAGSNLIWGAFIVLLLTWRPQRVRKPVQEALPRPTG